MKKVKFAVQTIVLVLAFPLWFYAEMKHTDKSVKANHVERVDSVNTKKTITVKEDKPGGNIDLQATGMQKLMVVSN